MKLKCSLLCLIVFLGFSSQQLLAQNITVFGKVKNKSSNEVLSGATINVKGTIKSTTTDSKGSYSISVAKGQTLVASYVGMTTQETVVLQAGEYNFSLEENSTLTDVVVVGYGTQKVTKVSGAISTVKSADIQKLNPVRLEEALQGSASGVNVIQSGSPGTKPTILIRGIPSLGGNDPTVIVDGIQQTTDDLNSINPADIESINVLKGENAIKKYGERAKNGVIEIKTKK